MKKVFDNFKKKCHSPAFLYIFLSILSLAILFLCVLFSHGDVLSDYFFFDETDTGMDFFHSIEYVNGRSPYIIFHTLYPPLANLFFYGLFHCIPMHVSQWWPLDFKESINMKLTMFDLRTNQATLMLFLGFIVFSIVITVLVIQRLLLKKFSITYTNAIIFCMIFSYGMMRAIERGNIITLIFPLTIFFVFYYDSDKPWLREIACICLAIAAGLKVYPAIMGILLIRDKKWKLAIRTVIYGLLSLFLPFLFFEGGITNVQIWVHQVMKFGTGSSQPWIGNALKSILYRIQNYVSYYLGIEISSKYFGIIAYAIIIVIFLCVLCMRKKWQKVLLVTMIMSLYSEQGNYIFLFYCIPLISFLLEEDRFSLENLFPYVGMICLVMPLPLFSMRNVSYPRTVLVHFIYIIMIIWCIWKAGDNTHIWNRIYGFICDRRTSKQGQADDR